MHCRIGAGLTPVHRWARAPRVGQEASPAFRYFDGVLMNEGDIVEDFELSDQHGSTVALSDLVESGPVVLFFYPRAMTPN